MHINMLKLAMFLWRSLDQCLLSVTMFNGCFCVVIPCLIIFEEATVHLHDQQVTFHQCVLIQFFK